MAKSKIYVGLEIGTTKTCMIVAEIKPDSSVKILGIGEERSSGIRKGEISDFPQARTAVKAALLNAEDVSDVDIASVFLSVTGSHIQGLNNRGTYRLNDDSSGIGKEDIAEVKEIAGDIGISTDRFYLHRVIREYVIDGQNHSTSPFGLMGKTLDADFHIIHGLKTRVQNSIKCVREIPLDVDDVVFAPLASAQIVLSKENKESGALAIDIGGGTTDYALYIEGSLVASGCIPVGGDHITNDIHLVTHIPLSKAEKIKISEGDASGNPSPGTVRVTDDNGHLEEEIERQTLNEIIRFRLLETMELVLEAIPKEYEGKIGSGVFLTGGASLTRGLAHLVSEVFGLPAFRPEAKAIDMSGVLAYLEEPQYSTALGLIRYAQIMEEERTAEEASVGGFIKKIWPFS